MRLWSILTLLVVPFGSLFAEVRTPIAAGRFVDSVGVNIHLHYDGTLYGNNFDLIKNRLLELGVRHVRDGLVDTEWREYYERHNALGRAGIRGVFITRPGMPASLLRDYPQRMANTFEAYEAPNEYNASGDPKWDSTLYLTLQELRSLRSIPGLAAFPVYGPSLTNENAYATLGDVSLLIDAGNLHNYFSGRHPGTIGWGAGGYGSIDWNLGLVRASAATKSVVTTETGYTDDTALDDAVPPDIVGKYMPRVLLEQFRKGVVRTYIYELCDYPTRGLSHISGYGLLTSVGVPKPAFNAVKHLLSLLSDPGTPITTQDLDYTIEGATAGLRHMLFQKRDGRYYLALWLEESSYDVNTRKDVAVAPRRITLRPPPTVRAVNSYRWGADGQVSRRSITAQTYGVSLPVTVNDWVTMIELRAQ